MLRHRLSSHDTHPSYSSSSLLPPRRCRSLLFLFIAGDFGLPLIGLRSLPLQSTSVCRLLNHGSFLLPLTSVRRSLGFGPSQCRLQDYGPLPRC
ncbi:hypothetical protein HanRHA438_Chr16g0778811 [Helianthus annuus]|nr:hypothetical protein HanRHA438_Chr16g0778811 [Helianthus annuus]